MQLYNRRGSSQNAFINPKVTDILDMIKIPPELLKYALLETHDPITEPLNNIFAKHEYINAGHGLLSALRSLVN